MADWYGLSEADADTWTAHFGVGVDQIQHDFAISRVLQELSTHASSFVFYGGTALSRTILNGLRLREDIDLLSVGPRRPVAMVLDEALRTGLERQFGLVDARPQLPDTRTGTQACLYRIADVTVQVQLIAGDNYTPWPRQRSQVSLRYAGLADVTLTTYTPAGFVGAKTVAWCDTTRNAPRDLYDLWEQEGRHGQASDRPATLLVTCTTCGPSPKGATSTLRPLRSSADSVPFPGIPVRGCSRNNPHPKPSGRTPSPISAGLPLALTKPTRQ